MQKSDFFYELPEELIASEPLPDRTASRLLVANGNNLRDMTVADIPSLVTPNDLMVFNNTEVLNARLKGAKSSGGKVEILVERLLGDAANPEFLAQIKSNKKLKSGIEIMLGGDAKATILAKQDDGFFKLKCDVDIRRVLAEYGEVPLPPYIKRVANSQDKVRYQTVYASRPGAVAAPTAGLHFDQPLLDAIAALGVDIGYTTLHVGAGTFQPMRCEDVKEHTMHSEFCSVDSKLCDQIEATKSRGGRVIAVGTTTTRALESASASGDTTPFAGDTNIFIYPGYEFKAVDVLMTNFHLPESTLIMLVAAFKGYEWTMAAYEHAVKARYRFFSYGDAMWLPSSN